MDSITKFNPLVSVIVPIYNSAFYLKKCLNSIIRQTYKNIEIILIDDGSKDKSLEICKHYLNKDKRIRLFSQTNSGVSAARNIGLQKAVGEYCVFVDSDDFVGRNYIKELVSIADNEDIVFGNMKIIYLFPHQKRNPQIKLAGDFKNFNDLYRLYSGPINKNGPVCKLFKLKIIRDHDLLFDEEMTHGEDLDFNNRYYCFCNSFKYSDKSIYFYNKLNVASATHLFYEKYFEIVGLQINYLMRLVSRCIGRVDAQLYKTMIYKEFLHAFGYYRSFIEDEDSFCEKARLVVETVKNIIDFEICEDDRHLFVGNNPYRKLIKCIVSDDYRTIYNIVSPSKGTELFQNAKLKIFVTKVLEKAKLFFIFKVWG